MSENKQLVNINFEDQKVIKTLQATVAKGATAEEFAMFTHFCQSTGLNPFKNEIWFIKANNRVQMMTGINGYFTVANQHPDYDGMQVETSYTEKGVPIESVCKVYRKDRRFPSIGRARWAEDHKPYGVWKEKPTLMLEKVSKSRALREAFPQELNGLYTKEEMDEEYSRPAEVQVVQEKPKPTKKTVAPKNGYVFYNVELDETIDDERKRSLYKQYKGLFERDSNTQIWAAEMSIEELEPFRVDPEHVEEQTS